MINSEDFAKRLEKIIGFYGETASSFSDKIGVQRSSISHILSGRNKPSLDFVLKILSEYPEVELYWLLNGKGSFPSTQEPEVDKPQIDSTITDKEIASLRKEHVDGNGDIERIVIFYKDGTFKNFENR